MIPSAPSTTLRGNHRKRVFAGLAEPNATRPEPNRPFSRTEPIVPTTGMTDGDSFARRAASSLRIGVPGAPKSTSSRSVWPLTVTATM